jgi:uncharacterized protein
VDEAAEASLQKLVLPSSVLGFVLSALCLGSIRGALLVLTIASFGQLIAIGLVFYTGNQFSAVLIVLPTLVFMLTLSGAIHLVNYFFEDHTERFPRIRDRGTRSIVIGWQPCLLSSATTMLGMGSLVTSQLAPVRQFGIFLSDKPWGCNRIFIVSFSIGGKLDFGAFHDALPPTESNP